MQRDHGAEPGEHCEHGSATRRHHAADTRDQRTDTHGEDPEGGHAAVAFEVERPRDVRGVEEAEQPERGEHQQPDHPPGPQSDPAVEHDRSAREDERDHHHHAHGRAHESVAEQAVLVRVHQELAAFGQRSPGLAGLHAPAFHRVGPVEPEVGEDGRRDVGEVDEAVALRGGRAHQAGLEAGAAHCRNGEQGVALLWRRRADDHDQVTRFDVVEQSADDAIGVLERAGAHLHRLLVGGEPGLDVGPHEVGAFDQHDRARVPRVGERALHPVRIAGAHRTARRRPAAAVRRRRVHRGPCPRSSSARRLRRAATAWSGCRGCSGRCRRRW